MAPAKPPTTAAATKEPATIKAIAKITLPLVILLVPPLPKGYHKSDLRRKTQRAKKPRGMVREPKRASKGNLLPSNP